VRAPVSAPSGAPSGAPDGIDPATLVELTRTLVDIPSPTGSEAACAGYLRDWLAARGIEADLQDLEPGRANVVARVRGTGRGPGLLLAGHIDTSYSGDADLDYAGLGPPGPNDRPQSYLVGEGVYGLGAFNQKGGLASAAVALTVLADGPPPDGDVVYAALAGESEKAPVAGAILDRRGPAFMGRGDGARRFLARGRPADYAVVTGPSALRVVNAQAGSLFVEVVACGRPAYLGRRPPGASGPIEVVADLIGAIGRWGRAHAEAHRHETGLGILEPRVTVGAVEGGWSFAPSTSPGVCHLYVDVRTGPGASQAAAVADLRSCLRAVADRHPDVDLRGRVYARNRGTQTSADDLLPRSAIAILEDELGVEARPFRPGAADTTNDTNHFRRAGLSAIKVGPSDGLDPDPEATAMYGPHVSRPDLLAAARLYVRLARRITSDPAADPGGTHP
jgi:acetylornithine deacetylase/succinyl-diaminopimelate desuccinylase-like protein